MRKPGLMNVGLAVGLLIGPGLGAIVHALLAMAAHGGQIALMPTLITNAGFGYLLMLPVFLPAMLVLRHLRVDSILAGVVLGFVIGLIFFYAVLGIIDSAWAPLVFQGGLPFALMLGATRLIAGRRT